MSASQALDKVIEARRVLDEATATLNANARGAIDAAIADIFAGDPEVQSVEFACKSSEYNDEGMYPGIAGPVINKDNGDDDYQPWLYDYRSEKDPRAKELTIVLEAVGEIVLCDIFGDEYIVSVKRDGDELVVSTEYAGY